VTAEDRAAAIVKEDGGGDYYYEGWAREYSIVVAIEAAEAAAYERAAKAIENNPAVRCGAAMDGDFFASIVRSLARIP
jgi:hypothetical protein